MDDTDDDFHRFSRIKLAMNTMCSKILNPYENVKSAVEAVDKLTDEEKRQFTAYMLGLAQED